MAPGAGPAPRRCGPSPGQPVSIPSGMLALHPDNIRTDLGDLRDLSASIAAEGILVPLTVQRHGRQFRVLFGARRLTAGRLSGLRSFPCLLREDSADDETLATMLGEVENREGISRSDRAAALHRLHTRYGWPKARIGAYLGRSPGTVAAWMNTTDRDPSARDGTDNDVEQAHRDDGDGDPGVGPPAGVAPRIPRSKRRAPAVVSVRKVRDLIGRWDDQLPAELVDELRALLGDTATGTTAGARGVELETADAGWGR